MMTTTEKYSVWREAIVIDSIDGEVNPGRVRVRCEE